VTRPDRDVLLCRDCCCGSATKHPATDHSGQEQALLTSGGVTGHGERVRVRVVDCLGQCDRSNVVLVRDFTRGRRPVDTWLGDVHDDDLTWQVSGWAERGGELPEDLAAHRFAPVVPGRG